MLSTSHKAFMIMDQLRLRAGITVPQLQHILKISQTTYSRISKRVYQEEIGALQGPMDTNVQRAIRVLVLGFRTLVLETTTIKLRDDEAAVILTELNESLDTLKTSVTPTCNLRSLIEAADGLML